MDTLQQADASRLTTAGIITGLSSVENVLYLRALPGVRQVFSKETPI